MSAARARTPSTSAAENLTRPEGMAASRLFAGRAPAAWTLPEQIAAEVGEQILNEQIAPGERIREEKLARDFGVSRGPTRDALKMLEQAGLVAIASRKGTIATPLTDDDMREIFVLHAGLSEIVVRGFAGHATPDNLAHFRRHLEATERLADDDRQALVWTEANDRLILFLAHNCGNSRVARILTTLSLQSVRYLRRALAAGLNPASRRHAIVQFNRDLLAAYTTGADLEPFVRRLRETLADYIRKLPDEPLPPTPGPAG